MRTTAPRPLSKKRSRINSDRDREFAAFAIGSDEEAPAETLPAEAETHGDIPVEEEDLFDDAADQVQLAADMTTAADIAAAVMTPS